MIWAPPEANAPEISIPLEVEGWHAIFVGVFSTAEVPSTAWIRLDTDPAPVPRYNSRTDYYGSSEEIFFRATEGTPATPDRTAEVQPAAVERVP